MIVNGIRWTGASSILLLLAYLIVYGWLFHLVTADEFAVFSLAQAVVNLGMNITAPAFGNAIVSQEKLTVGQFSTALWLNVLLGMLLGAITFSTSNFLENIYESPGLRTGIQLISFSIPLTCVGQPFKYLLQRNEAFKWLSIFKMIAFLTFAVTAILGGYKGYGVSALVLAFVFQILVETLLLLIWGVKIIQPTLTVNKDAVTFFTKFGLFQGSERLVDTLISQADTFLIGHLLGLNSLGIYEAVKRVLVRPINLISEAVESVVFPVMSNGKEKKGQLRALFLLNVRFLCLLCFLPYLIGAFFSEPISAIFFANDWTDASMVFSLFSLVILLRLPRMPTDALIMANEKPKLWLIWKSLQLILTLMAILIGFSAGLFGMLISLILLQFILGILNYLLLIQKLILLSFTEYLKTFIPILVVSFSAVAIGFLISELFEKDWLKLVSGSLLSILFFGVWTLIFNQKDSIRLLAFFKL
jgi:teichuronic acid exporter